MKIKLLRVIRWGLIGLLSALLVWMVYGAAGMAFRFSPGDGWDWFTCLGTFLGVVLCGFFPSCMLFSLLTKRLRLFIYCVGTMAAILVFGAALGLPRYLNAYETIDSITFLPGKVILGLTLAGVAIALPCWLGKRVLKLTTEVIYPRYVEPLESRL